MGDWIYYVTFLRMDQIADQIHIAQEIHSSHMLKDMIQRQITNRAGQIAEYLLNQPQHFFNRMHCYSRFAPSKLLLGEGVRSSGS